MSEAIETLNWWVTFCYFLTAASTTSFPILYLFSPWWKSHMGRAIMFQTAAFALVVDATLIFRFWSPGSIMLSFAIQVVLLTIVAAATSALTGILWLANYERKQKEIQMEETQQTHPLLSNASYDRLKWVTMIVLPAIGTLYFTLAPMWGFPKAHEVVGSLAATTTFFGVILGFASRSYKNSGARFNGDLELQHREDGSKLVTLKLDAGPDELAEMDEVVFKVNK